jgi:N-methylhydantoinase B
MVETDMPVEILRYELVADSGGAGEFRGGLAFVREFRFLSDARFTMRGDRRDHPPYGIDGGRAGSPSAHLLIRAGGAERQLPTMPLESFSAQAGDIFRLTGAGGGGFGDALKRDPARVAEDLREGKVSREGAVRDYGVVFSNNGASVDAAATRRRRDEMMEARR